MSLDKLWIDELWNELLSFPTMQGDIFKYCVLSKQQLTTLKV